MNLHPVQSAQEKGGNLIQKLKLNIGDKCSDEDIKRYTQIILEGVEVAAILLNVQNFEFCLTRVSSILNQVLPTAFILGTSYWVFYQADDGRNLCICNIYKIPCRHKRGATHCVNMESIDHGNNFTFDPFLLMDLPTSNNLEYILKWMACDCQQVACSSQSILKSNYYVPPQYFEPINVKIPTTFIQRQDFPTFRYVVDKEKIFVICITMKTLTRRHSNTCQNRESAQQAAIAIDHPAFQPADSGRSLYRRDIRANIINYVNTEGINVTFETQTTTSSIGQYAAGNAPHFVYRNAQSRPSGPILGPATFFDTATNRPYPMQAPQSMPPQLMLPQPMLPRPILPQPMLPQPMLPQPILPQPQWNQYYQIPLPRPPQLQLPQTYPMQVFHNMPAPPYPYCTDIPITSMHFMEPQEVAFEDDEEDDERNYDNSMEANSDTLESETNPDSTVYEEDDESSQDKDIREPQKVMVRQQSEEQGGNPFYSQFESQKIRLPIFRNITTQEVSTSTPEGDATPSGPRADAIKSFSGNGQCLQGKDVIVLDDDDDSD